MRITKVWLRQAKTRIQDRVKELVMIHQLGGEEAIRKEFSRVFPYRPTNEYPAFWQEMMRVMVYHYIEDCIPSSIVD